jgi:hypothetical protein
MGFDIYLSWDGMTTKDEDAQDNLWDTRYGHTGYLRAGLPMKKEIRMLGDVFPDVPWWEGPPRMGNAKSYDFVGNFQKMKVVAENYLKETGSSRGIDYFLSLSPRSVVPDPADNGLAPSEVWVRSLVDFFNLGLRMQKEGKNPRVEVT